MVWTPEQTGRFLDHIADHRFYALYRVIANRRPARPESGHPQVRASVL